MQGRGVFYSQRGTTLIYRHLAVPGLRECSHRNTRQDNGCNPERPTGKFSLPAPEGLPPPHSRGIFQHFGFPLWRAGQVYSFPSSPVGKLFSNIFSIVANICLFVNSCGTVADNSPRNIKILNETMAYYMRYGCGIRLSVISCQWSVFSVQSEHG